MLNYQFTKTRRRVCAIVPRLVAGFYTAIIRVEDDTVRIDLIEADNLQ